MHVALALLLSFAPAVADDGAAPDDRASCSPVRTGEPATDDDDVRRTGFAIDAVKPALMERHKLYFHGTPGAAVQGGWSASATSQFRAAEGPEDRAVLQVTLALAAPAQQPIARCRPEATKFAFTFDAIEDVDAYDLIVLDHEGEEIYRKAFGGDS